MTDLLYQQLAHQQREIHLLHQFDDLRDRLQENTPADVMNQSLLKLCMTLFDATQGVLYLPENHEHSAQLAVIGMNPASAQTLCEQALQTSLDAPPQPFQAENGTSGVIVRIALYAGQPLGVLLLIRTTPFTEEDLTLLAVAESQLDSAIIQAQRTWRLVQRKRELDAIYRLDRLRDEKPDENDLINGFVQVIVEQYNAELCLVMLNNPETHEMTIRSMTDKLGLKPQDYNTLLQTAQQLTLLSNLPAPKPNTFCMGIPFVINGVHLGAVVIGRKSPFNADDKRLLVAMTSQIDSAIVYSRVIKQLSQRTKELEIIYHIDHIRDSEKDFDAMLQAILGELCNALESQMSYILLYTVNEEDQLEIKSAVENGGITPEYYEAIYDISRQALQNAQMVHENQRGGAVRSIVAIPLMLHNRIIGVFGGVNSLKSEGFNADDRRILAAIVSQADTAVFERLEQRRVRQVLGRSVDPKVLEHLLQNANNSDILAGERMTISVLFADLRGSTEWAERTEPYKLAHTLNAYLGRMTDVIFEYGGTLDKFVGDEVIGLFGAPLAMPDHAERCAAAALKMQAVMADLIAEMHTQGYELPPMGVGVSTGDAICGEFGTSTRTDYTAMGRVMNLGARLCGVAKGGEVIISEATHELLMDKIQAEPRTDIALKGIGKSTAYHLISIET